MSRWVAVSWAIGLGLLTGAITGTLTPAQSLDQEMRHVFGLSIVFVPALYVILTRQWDRWRATNGYVRFAVYVVSLLVAAGTLTFLSVVVLGSTGLVGRGGAFVAATVAFVVAAWVAFGGGADWIWAELIDRGVVDW